MKVQGFFRFLVLLAVCSLASGPVFAQSHGNSAREMMEEFSRMFEEQNRRMNDLILDFFDRDRMGSMEDLQELEFRSSLGGVSSAEVRRQDDEKYIIFELQGQGIDPNALDVNVREGMVTISGQTRHEDTSENENQFFQSTSISSFSRTFPIPGDADPHSVKVEQNDDKIQVKFERRRI